MNDRLLFLDSEMNMPVKMVVLPLRSTAVKLTHALVLISPVDFTTNQIQKIKEMGEVTDIVAPSLIHYLFLEHAIRLFPKATVWGPPGCQKKLPNIPWNKLFETDVWPYENELKTLFLDGAPRLNEIAFLDVSTKTLIVGDLCFNIHHPKGWASPLMLRLLGTYKTFAVSRLLGRMLSDPKVLEPRLEKMMEWDFEQIAMGHGEIVRSNGKKLLLAAVQKRGYLQNLSINQ